jgi:2,3-bisphosphoglycerate-dependent phosphoglycerate mutase
MLRETQHLYHSTCTSTLLRLRVQFTGWHDVPLSEVGVEEATGAGKLIAEEGFQFDAVYTSGVKRAVQDNCQLAFLCCGYLSIDQS